MVDHVDRRESAQRRCRGARLGIDDVVADLLPRDKCAVAQRLQAEHQIVALVKGDLCAIVRVRKLSRVRLGPSLSDRSSALFGWF